MCSKFRWPDRIQFENHAGWNPEFWQPGSVQDFDRTSQPGPPPSLSDTMYLFISFRKSPPPQNRQLDILISNSQQ